MAAALTISLRKQVLRIGTLQATTAEATQATERAVAKSAAAQGSAEVKKWAEEVAHCHSWQYEVSQELVLAWSAAGDTLVSRSYLSDSLLPVSAAGGGEDACLLH